MGLLPLLDTLGPPKQADDDGAAREGLGDAADEIVDGGGAEQVFGVKTAERQNGLARKAGEGRSAAGLVADWVRPRGAGITARIDGSGTAVGRGHGWPLRRQPPP